MVVTRKFSMSPSPVLPKCYSSKQKGGEGPIWGILWYCNKFHTVYMVESFEENRNMHCIGKMYVQVLKHKMS